LSVWNKVKRRPGHFLFFLSHAYHYQVRHYKLNRPNRRSTNGLLSRGGRCHTFAFASTARLLPATVLLSLLLALLGVVLVGDDGFCRWWCTSDQMQAFLNAVVRER
jgi:hypothetical protein